MSDRRAIYTRLFCAILVCASTWFAAETVDASSRLPDQVYLMRYSLGPLYGRSPRYLVFRAKLNAAGDKKQPERPTISSFKGAGYWLDGCPTEKDRQDYICFLSDYFSFTYPKNRKPEQLGWSVGDGQYKILQQEFLFGALG